MTHPRRIPPTQVAAEQHPFVRSIILHLLPGALLTAFYILAAPLVRSWGFPSLFAIFLAIVFVLIPFELGYLLYQARKHGHRTLFRGVIRYLEPVPAWQMLLLIVGLFIWSGVVAVLLYPPLDSFFLRNVFAWLPTWFFLDTEDFSRYSSTALAVTWGLGVILNGFAAPVVEELYFRGYLLPRMKYLGGWAPLVNSVLFSLYHFFTPWQNLGRILALTPLVYAVWWKRNLWIGIVVHVLGNLFTMAGLFAVFFR